MIEAVQEKRSSVRFFATSTVEVASSSPPGTSTRRHKLCRTTLQALQPFISNKSKQQHDAIHTLPLLPGPGRRKLHLVRVRQVTQDAGAVAVAR